MTEEKITVVVEQPIKFLWMYDKFHVITEHHDIFMPIYLAKDIADEINKHRGHGIRGSSEVDD